MLSVSEIKIADLRQFVRTTVPMAMRGVVSPNPQLVRRVAAN